MIVEILRNDDNEIIGYSMRGETPEEIKKAGIIRDMYFWRTGNRCLEYGGRHSSDDANKDPGTLTWLAEKDKDEFWEKRRTDKD